MFDYFGNEYIEEYFDLLVPCEYYPHYFCKVLAHDRLSMYVDCTLLCKSIINWNWGAFSVDSKYRLSIMCLTINDIIGQ